MGLNVAHMLSQCWGAIRAFDADPRLGAAAVPPSPRSTRVSADSRIAHPQLRCAQCGLVYSRVAVAREITLSMGIDCRRCGGALHRIDEAPTERNEIVAVGSPVSGPGRRRFE
jgi:hypothetical protein